MKDNNLLMIIMAFVIGYCLQGMMKNMCGGRLIEGSDYEPSDSQSCCSDPDNPFSDAICKYKGERTSGGEQHGVNLSLGCWCCNDSNCKGDNVCSQNNENGCGGLGYCKIPDPWYDL
jgi:hypothetical protein